MKKMTSQTTAMAGLLFLGINTALAEPLYVGSYGGSTEQAMRDEIIPAFLEEHDAEIIYVAGNSTDTLAKLQAQRGDQERDVVLMDDGPMYQAVNLGFCSPMQDTAMLDDVYDIARFPDDKAVGVGLVASGFAYNADMFERNGWEPPSSWKDLADEKFAGKLVVPSISNTYGVHALVMAARLNGGSESDIDPGFEFMQEQVAPNILSFEPSAGKMSELFQNEEIALSVWGSGRLRALASTGFPGAFAYPEEGAVALMVAACVIEGSEERELAEAFIEHLLAPESQELLADTQGWGPAQRNAQLSDELASVLPYGEKIDQLVAVDWDVINPNRLEWTNRWNRQVER